MCGIFFETEAKFNSHLLTNISHDLKHRGPDNTQLYFDHELHFSSVFTRLAVQDLSLDSNQPFFSPDNQFILYYNGEIYNLEELRNKLPVKFELKTKSDTEILLLNLIHFGLNSTLNDIEGMFAFILVDKRNNCIYAVRDMFGIKPLYYTTNSSGKFVFSSEIRPLQRISSLSVNSGLLREFILCGLIDHTDGTLFTEVRKVIPGTYIKIQDNRSEVINWVELEDTTIKQNGMDEFINNLQETLQKDFYNSLVSDVPVHLNISSGIDSNLIRKLLKNRNINLNLHSVSWDDREFSEIERVQQIIDRDENFTVHSFSASETMKLILNSFEIFDEPFTSAFVAVWPKVYSEIKSLGGSVVLDGNGADEIFYGYNKYLNPIFDKYSIRALDGVDVSLGFQSYFIDEPKNLIEANNLDLFSIKLPRSLRFLDYASMSASVETRPIYLTKGIFELSRSIPLSWLIHNGQTKYPLRRILVKLGMDEVATRKKQDIQLPQNKWIGSKWRGTISNQFSGIEKVIENLSLAREKDSIYRVVNNFNQVKGPDQNSIIWRIFISSLWLDKFSV